MELLGVNEAVMLGLRETDGVNEGVPVGDACATCATDTF